MSTHKYIDKICCVAIALAIILTILFMNAASFGIEASETTNSYENRLFDTSAVHTIDIVMDDWDGFLDTCINEEYTICTVVIDNESYKNVGIRAKGNTSLTQVSSYGNDRYSFKIEFDHYDSTKSYYGLDKLSLNNIIQDNTYLKDYLTYQMMGTFGVDAPLCSYVYITVNGEDWGLYLAVEGVEESFLSRNYGNDYGELYKPDSQSMGGGRGNGGKFEIDEWQSTETDDATDDDNTTKTNPFGQNEMQPPGGMNGQNGMMQLPDESRQNGFSGSFSGNTDEQTLPNEGMERPMHGEQMGGIGGGMGSSDVSLIYTDDEYESYQNIFDNAKTDITDADKDRLIASLKQLNEAESIEEVVNVDEVLRYFVVHNFVCNFDSYTGSMIHNYYLYEEDGQLFMIPWDYNLAFGGFQGAQDATALVNYPIDSPVSGGTIDSRPMLAWIFASEEYTNLYHEYFENFIANMFDSGDFAQMIDEVETLIAPYVEQDPTKFCTYEEFETGVATLKEFCLLRAESISGQLDGTIPSTSDAQSRDDSALIDASSIDISAMGTMNNQMGGMNGGMGKPFEQSSESEQSIESNTSLTQGQKNETESNSSDTQTDQGQIIWHDSSDSSSSESSSDNSTSAGMPSGRPQFDGQSGGTMQPPGGMAGAFGQDGTSQPPDAMAGATKQDDTSTQVPDNGQNNGMQPPDSAAEQPGQNGMTMPSERPGQQQSASTAVSQNDSSWLFVLISGIALLIGIVIAVLYKKRV